MILNMLFFTFAYTIKSQTFDSASKFAAVFKEAKGKTPLEYRREGR